jgi:Sec-independent protein translocase protein TatA
MPGRTIHRKPLAVAGSVAIAVVVLGGCFGEIRAERTGKQAGEAICDVKNASNGDDAQRQADQAQRKLNDVQRIVGRPINEDLRDINQNMTDLIEHVRQGNKALAHQDVAVIERNVQAVSRTLTGKARAAYDGMQEGLAECD